MGPRGWPWRGWPGDFTLALSLPEVHSKRGALKVDPRKGRGRRFQMPPAPPLPLHAGFLSREHFHFLLLRLPSEQVGPLGTQHLAFVPTAASIQPFPAPPMSGSPPKGPGGEEHPPTPSLLIPEVYLTPAPMTLEATRQQLIDLDSC